MSAISRRSPTALQTCCRTFSERTRTRLAWSTVWLACRSGRPWNSRSSSRYPLDDRFLASQPAHVDTRDRVPHYPRAARRAVVAEVDGGGVEFRRPWVAWRPLLGA